METILFTKEKTKRLRKRYDLAVKEGQESFWFEDNQYLTSYAKYVLEYLEGRLKEKK